MVEKILHLTLMKKLQNFYMKKEERFENSDSSKYYDKYNSTICRFIFMSRANARDNTTQLF